VNRLAATALVLLLAALPGCLGRSGEETASAAERREREARLSAEVRSALDPEADACEDFYRYACGGWIDATALPPDKPFYGRSFGVIADRNEDLLRRLLEAPAPDPLLGRANDAYAACMDEEAIERAGVSPLAPLLAAIDLAREERDVYAVAARLARETGADAFLDFGVSPDYADPGVAILHLVQGGLGLPERGYYLDAENRALLEEYEAHVRRTLVLAGASERTAARDARRVVAFEREIAERSRKPAELRDVDRFYHRLERDGLQRLDPHAPWGAFFDALGRPDLREIDVTDPEYVTCVAALVRATPPATLRAYLRWRLLDAAAPSLSRAFVDEDFSFAARLLGQKSLPPRWKRCVRATTAAFPDLVGQLFVRETFSGASKPRAEEMIAAVEDAFVATLATRDWMDDATRAAAREKAERLANKIGYPVRWKDYAGVRIERARWFETRAAAWTWRIDTDLAKVGTPVDRTEWRMAASAVNAYYDPSVNEMVFPAGILQPPFFSAAFPSAMNYGAMGAVMGHELTHGFDDQGRKFDAEGRKRAWWSPEVAGRFEERARCVAEQFDGYRAADGSRVNGQLTLGENLADLGGVKTAHRAWRERAERHPEASPVPGLSSEQLFFVAWGQSWCTRASPEYERLQVTVDPHAPARFRVNGPLSNLPEFARAFGCAEDAAMRRAPACEVW
jgi:predicted metalloendopeptidase